MFYTKGQIIFDHDGRKEEVVLTNSYLTVFRRTQNGQVILFLIEYLNCLETLSSAHKTVYTWGDVPEALNNVYEEIIEDRKTPISVFHGENNGMFVNAALARKYNAGEILVILHNGGTVLDALTSQPIQEKDLKGLVGNDCTIVWCSWGEHYVSPQDKGDIIDNVYCCQKCLSKLY